MINSKKAILSHIVKQAIDKEIQKYPAGKKRAAVMAALMFVQKENNGYLTTDLMDAVAEYLDMQPIQVYEVANFYSMYELQPVGCHKISVCTNVPCMLRGAEEIGDHLKKSLGINYGETTPDGKVTLREVECLGACVSAPLLQINDQIFYEKLTPESVDSMLENLLKEEAKP